ncbi:restriction system protein [Prosthecobacter debontii]|uniref:Restriction system protein n=1 Tax=Prosthecobacter debontii TaxID=48467 RepID=A0A1T4Z1M1_9BACT|nr:restriction endonuclease [Prosthecobacter debontii]SKB07940.1 restriction system protein [Prosthecobacter debontii]
MSLWLIRAGAHGEFELTFLEENRVYVTWLNLAHDLHKLENKDALISILETLDPSGKPKKWLNHASQIWPFAHTMQKGDWVVLPLKTQQSIYIGEITSDYHFEPEGPNPFYHWRSVKWIGEAIPRQRFGQDLLHSFGAFLTICRIQRNNAEARIQAMKASGWGDDPGKKGLLIKAKTESAEIDDEELADDLVDLEQQGLDRIATMIQAKFAGHGFTRLVESILKAQGYTTYLSPEGADGGADILAGMGALGFGSPQLCVEVKSELKPIDRETVDKLLGAMSKFNAAQGLFVSWGGFKTNVQKELAQSFFKVRLWTQKDLLDALFAHYDQLDADIRAELPLTRIWTVAVPEE